MGMIHIGRSGWRGILGQEFILDNTRVVTRALGEHLIAAGQQQGGIVIGHDSRFLGERFARDSVCVLAGADIQTFLCNRDTPTPVISREILQRGAAGGIIFTASHYPAEFNGIKFPSRGGRPASDEALRDIEQRANALRENPVFPLMALDDALQSGWVEEIDPRPGYFAALEKIVDFPVIADSGLTIAVNPLFGSARGYLDELLQRTGVKTICVNNHRDPYFGGFPPKPSAEYLGDFMARIRGDSSISLGLCTDGDGDRYGIIDQGGVYIDPNQVLALLYDYLIRVRDLRGDAARSVTTSHLLDAVALYHGLQVHETPVGFEAIGDYLRDERILMGGEESGSLSMAGHIPERDGILACLLVAEMISVEGKTLQHLFTELTRRVGSFHSRKESLRLSPGQEKDFAGKIASSPDRIAGDKVVRVAHLDGAKFFFEDDSWVLFRKSDTEPVINIYCEARTLKRQQTLFRNARGFIGL